MAQQKRNPRPPAVGTSSRPAGRGTNGSGASTRRRSSSSTGSSRGSASSRGSKRPRSGGSRGSDRIKVTSGSNGLTDIAKKAKTPALAAGAGLAGLVGGLALAKRTSRKRILGVPMPNGGVSKNLVEASKNVGSFGEGMGSLAAELRRAREGVATAGEAKRSPIEVVLQGLTTRR